MILLSLAINIKFHEERNIKMKKYQPLIKQDKNYVIIFQAVRIPA